MITDLCEVRPVAASTFNRSGSESPPMASPPIFNSDRRLNPSQCWCLAPNTSNIRHTPTQRIKICRCIRIGSTHRRCPSRSPRRNSFSPCRFQISRELKLERVVVAMRPRHFGGAKIRHSAAPFFNSVLSVCPVANVRIQFLAAEV